MTREEILQAFDDINFVYNDCTRYDTLKRMLEELTERKRGEWAEEGYCPFCKCDMPAFIEDWEWKRCRTPYCPNCGAKMDESEEKDDTKRGD